MNGPRFLRSAGDLDVVIGPYAPTFIEEDQRVIFLEGSRGFVSADNFEWMKTATPAELGAMRMIRISDAPPEWLPKPPKLPEFRYDHTPGGPNRDR